ncbi:unnamed protein product [Bemisia tabaci]|uniref:Actin-related protein 2/3 complex subunit n=1 Tax=Bemisia tabaci TaxID=7038 RepID=A0A9P0AAN7_BEMTA|nr:PREDICTED: actin-related protein 2/3 complex subunit 1A [Bemisia tabaci]CAH0386857.1 unnamed protein product [Bemisia tabaci]
MSERHSFGVEPITCHAWNHDKTQLALSLNNQDVHIYEQNKVTNEWKLMHTLSQHELRVTGIDWAPRTNQIVTCSVDRNAYVWRLDSDGKWKPFLAMLRINRAATCVRWSPEENKFAAGTGARLISVSYFEKQNNWWLSKHIKKPIKSTVSCLDWHPNNMLLVVGTSDFKVKVYSVYIKDIEDPAPATSWGSKHVFGTPLAEFHNSSFGGGWVHSVAFSGDGNRICWVAHNSSINIADASNGNISVTSLKTQFLPFNNCMWVRPDSILVAGYSCCPLLFSVNAKNSITFVCKLDSSQKKESGGISAMRKFQSLDRQAKVEVNTSLETIHQNAITCTKIFSGVNGNVAKFSTSGLDGQLVIWDLNLLESSMQNMKIS